jgi:F-type H+-transporting ATPase subunit b
MSRISMTGRAVRIAALSGASMLAASPSFASGMPQLQFGNPLTLGQLFWGAVIFLVLYLVLSRSALPRVASVLDERRNRIEGDLDAAKLARNEADRAIDELRRARHDAAVEANAIVDTVVAEARAAAAARTAEMNARLGEEIERAERSVAEARQTAMGSIRGVASETAQVLVERLVGRPADPALVDAKVDGALAARPA